MIPEPRDLVADLRSSDRDDRERAWRLMYDRHYDRVFRLVCRFGVESGEVEDITQRAFITAYKRIQEVDDVRDPFSWLCGIVVRVVAQHRRWRRVRTAKRWLLRETPAASPRPVIAPDRGAAVAQKMDAVRAVLDRMSDKLRTILVLCDIEELRPQEAADLLDIPVNTVRSRRRIAKAKFHELWTEQHGEEMP